MSHYPASEYERLIALALEKYGRPASINSRRNGFHIHHIKPCCMFLGGRKDPRANVRENLIYLTTQEHVEAHRLLTLIFPQNKALSFAYNNLRAKVDGPTTQKTTTRNDRSTCRVQPVRITPKSSYDNPIAPRPQRKKLNLKKLLLTVICGALLIYSIRHPQALYGVIMLALYALATESKK
ncbi:TPA: HNH endonuclease [Enterobacter hormaechei subsp. xiangfangensis]|nr:HNH endonuclease [Enterobacter hormaechei subsp. xiangfangensis]HAV1890603.1 HNH endonuclease [Enterobacter hormaechei subsp. xiangfangensis]